MQEITVTSLEELNDAISAHPLVLVDFFKDNCAGCAMLAKSLDVLDKRFEVDDVVLIKAKMETVGEDAFVGLGLRMLPTLMVYKAGALQKKLVGSSSPAIINTALVKARK